MNEQLTYQVLQAAIDIGVSEFILCPSSRNSSFVLALKPETDAMIYYWFEERSAAFFALGRSKLTQRPVAVVTSSGTAAAELLPAAMEAYYTGIPLLLITADRPRRFRGKGAPQSADQIGLFGLYTPYSLDVESHFPYCFSGWDQKAPAHINVCFEEPQGQPAWQGQGLKWKEPLCKKKSLINFDESEKLDQFFSKVQQPLVVVSALKSQVKEDVVQFLIKLNAPLVLEGISGIREDERLKHLVITGSEKILASAAQAGYSVDGVLRIGGIPTQRLWRDLEYSESRLDVCSISDVPFSGLSWNDDLIHVPIDQFLRGYSLKNSYDSNAAKRWFEEDQLFKDKLSHLFETEPTAEPSLIYQLSRLIPKNSLVYLGNSLPIREWDMAALREDRNITLFANKGMNGIDGQLSTFLGTCSDLTNNWGVFGDLTALYDMAGPWILSQLEGIHANIVIINNSGGKIFERMYADVEMQNCHHLNFEPLAKMWGLSYEKWEFIPDRLAERGGSRLIEIVPDNVATKRFWDQMAKNLQTIAS